MPKNRHSSFTRRQHMLEPVYEIFYFSDVNLGAVAPHSHDFYELYFFLEGDVELTIDENKYWIHPSQFYFVPPGLTHFPAMIGPDKPYRRFVLWINKTYYAQLKADAADYGYMEEHLIHPQKYVFSCEPIIFNEIQSLIFRLIDEERNDRFGKQVQSLLILNELLLFLNRIVYEADDPTRVKQSENIYQKVSYYVDEHLDGDLSLDAIAAGLYLNKFYLSHAFKEESGLSLHQFVIKRRLSACRNAILNEEASCRVCLDFGFADYSSFYRAFKKEYGISPKEFQKQMLNLRKP